jgi:GNAT superfamily N-acetyltransferase
LLKHCVDQLRIVNDGRSGIRLEMSWFLPGDSIVDQVEPLGGANPEPCGEVELEEWIGELGPEYAIQVARLVHQGYGYSYVYEDVYYPSRIHSHYKTGTLRSLGGITGSGRLVGHLALMRDAANASAVEWGLVVVDPSWRGRRIMERLLAAAEKTVCAGGESVFYAHAVTAHPYTQKACERFGFYPTALLVCYAPATMSFRGINPQLTQRESTFIAVRLMQPPPPATLYLPKAYAEIVQRIFQGLGVTPGKEIRFRDLEDNGVWDAALTRYSSSMIASVNGANIVIEQAGEDGDLVVHHELRRLCNERIDVIYLTVNLEDAGAARIIRAAEARGFFFAGVTPQVMGIPYGLTLQFMNNLKIEGEAIHAFDGSWQQLKAYVMLDKARVERG